MIALLKALHIAALSIWCAGLVLLPVLMQFNGRGEAIRHQEGYTLFRRISHFGYTIVITPAAIIAVAAGTALILMMELVSPWLLAKLVAVCGMVLVHAWLGHLIVRSGEGAGDYRMPPPLIALVLGVPLMLTVLWLVLAKPDLTGLTALLPGFLLEPQGRDLPGILTPI
ncbi:MAG: CopD family protein [Salinarimonas sp.]